MKRHLVQTVLFCLSLTILAAFLAPAAEAISYLKVDDKIILKDGTEIVGTIVFRAKTLIVIMVEGEEKHIKGDNVLKVERSKIITGMVETKKGTEPKRPPAEPKKEPEKEPEPKKKEPAPEPKPEPEKKPEPAKKPKPQEKPELKPEVIL